MSAQFGVRAAVGLAGFTAAAAQIVALRELMAVFGGAEISLGLALAAWLLWTAVGSLAAGRVARRTRNPRRLMALLEALAALALPFTVVAIRALKGVLQTAPGESVGPAGALAASLAALAPLCLISGALFAAGAAVFAREAGRPVDEGAPAAYLFEALGSAAGCLVAGLILVRYLGSLQIAGVLAWCNLAAACGLGLPKGWARRAAAGVLAGTFVLLWLPTLLPRLEAASQSVLWPGLRLAVTRNSPYGSLAVVEMEGARGVYENGLLLFQAPDPQSAEESVHFALLEHPEPRTLLLIGGGANGSLLQALQHPSIERVDYVELDPAVLDLAREYFPQSWAAAVSDPRVHVHATDGRLFVKTARTRYDVIIVNLPDPQTAQLNRFYTVEFFREAAAALAPDGILSLRLAASENYLSPDRAEFLQSIVKTLHMEFPEVVAIPGETAHLLAARRAGMLVRDAGTLLARLRERRLTTSYVREYYLPFQMAPERMRAFEQQTEPGPRTRVNYDFEPVAYYFDMTLWSGQFGLRYARFLRAVAAVDFPRLAGWTALLAAAIVVAGRLARGSERKRRVAAGSCVAAMGFTLMGLETLLLLAYQAVYGSVYRQLALLVGVFMGGMALGSWLGVKAGVEWGRAPGLPSGSPVQEPRPTSILAGVQIAAALAPLGLCALLAALPRSASPAAGQWAFLLPALTCGALGGFQFPMASRVFRSCARQGGPGTLYALDLAGSCLGAILFCAYLIPVFGFVRTAVLAAEINLAPALLAAAAPVMGSVALRKPQQ